jgi:mannose-6-phosphate isomerase-like protein (cupin superfamily)
MSAPSDAEISGENFAIARLDEISPTPCPCGQAKRAFMEQAEGVASMHIVEIKRDSETHYHKRMTEIYYVLEGTGEIELDGERQAIQPGDTILIKPGCRHRAIGQLTILNTAIPAFDVDDEWFD